MKDLYCSNCGAKIYVHSDRCPYCGFINVSGAEEKYMDSLEDIRSRLDNVDEEAATEYGKKLELNLRLILKCLAILAAITVVILAIRAVYNAKFSYDALGGTEAEQIDEIKWQKETFARFDKLYEDGDYETMVNEVCRTWYKGHEVYNWKHWDFASVMDEYYRTVRDDIADIEAGKTDDYLYTNMVYCTFKFYYETYGYYAFEDKEKEVIAEARNEVLKVLYERLHFTDKQMEELNKKYGFTQNGYVSFADCKKIAKDYRKQFD